MNHIKQFKAARRVSVPIVAINTPDPAVTVSQLSEAANGKDHPYPKVQWNLVQGLSGINQEGVAWCQQVLSNGDPTVQNPVELCSLVLDKLPQDGLLFIHMGHRWIENAGVVQAIWNLRDPFKGTGRMVVMLGKGIKLPVELQDDVIVIHEELPTEEELSDIVSTMHEAAGVPLDNSGSAKAVEALRGLSSFAAEQVTAMSLSQKGLDMDSLWKRKKQQIEQCPALKVLDDKTETFESIGGCAVVKDYLARIVRGNGRPNAVVFIDEIEKAMGGQGDTSGVNQDQLGVMLSYMQDHKAAGMIFVGPPGAAKSAIAKATGNEAGIPTIQLDLGAAKGSLVGQSEQQIREALKVVTAVSNNKSLWIATCNSIAELPPELRRRYTLGTFFFDLPTADERAAIWSIYERVYNIFHERPIDDGWTGAEIKQCCEITWRLGCTLKEAAEFIVPVSRSAADKIDALRKQADGRFLSASVPGTYKVNRPVNTQPKTRKIAVEA